MYARRQRGPQTYISDKLRVHLLQVLCNTSITIITTPVCSEGVAIPIHNVMSLLLHQVFLYKVLPEYGR